MQRKKFDYKKLTLDLLFMGMGSVLLAFAITAILKPSGIITGGITGLSIMIDKVFNIKYTYAYYAQSLLILISTFIIMGKREGFKIIVFSTIFPLVLIYFDELGIVFVENDLMLASIYYGIIGGAGCGILLKRGFSQGGSDTIGKILHYKLFPFISISQIILVIDVSVIISSTFIFERNIALYAILTQVVMKKAVDTMLFGFGSRKVKIEIISEENEKITNFIMNTINRGVSSYEIKGGYTNENKIKMVSICSPRESMIIKRYIADIDPNAFVDVLPVISVWGKGVGFESLVEEI